MMLIQRAFTALNLLKPIVFAASRARRPSSVPTQSTIMEPFSINKLHDNPGATRNSKIVGRGPGSGKGYFIVKT